MFLCSNSTRSPTRTIHNFTCSQEEPHFIQEYCSSTISVQGEDRTALSRPPTAAIGDSVVLGLGSKQLPDRHRQTVVEQWQIEESMDIKLVVVVMCGALLAATNMGINFIILSKL
jgi:hypothetical protein